MTALEALDVTRKSVFDAIFGIIDSTCRGGQGSIEIPVTKTPASIRLELVNELTKRGFVTSLKSFPSGGGSMGYLLNISWEK